MSNKNPPLPVSVAIDNNIISVTLLDGRVITNPLDMHQWLKDIYETNPSLLDNPELTLFSVWWPKIDEGLDVEGMIMGISSNPNYRTG